MNPAIKRLVKKIRFTEGQRDAASGKMPQRSSKYYLDGYAQQYAKEQILTALTAQPF